MTLSMTGFGKAAATEAGCSVSVEIRSVNHRYFTLKCRLPAGLSATEAKLSGIIRRKIGRGTVDLAIRLVMDEPTLSWVINEKLLRKYSSAALGISKMKGVRGSDLPVEALLALPGVVESREETQLSAGVIRAVTRTVEEAVARLNRMRESEGKRLESFIKKQRRIVEKQIDKIDRRAPAVVKDHALRVRKRVETLLNGQKLDPSDPALQREVAFLADRCDITEEIDRLRSHLTHFDETIEKDGAMGRSLDFIIQEMGREINTIGAKASDAAISQHVVMVKAELEKIREQVQNIE